MCASMCVCVCIILAGCNVVNKPKVSSVVENARSQRWERERDRERDLINFVGKIRALKRIGGIELKKNGFVVSFFSRSSMICVDLLKKKGERYRGVTWMQGKCFLTEKFLRFWKYFFDDESWIFFIEFMKDKILERKLLRDFEDSF